MAGKYLGSYTIDDLLTFYFDSHTPSTSADVDADAVPTYRIYEEETGTPILTGSGAKLDDAGTTGFYSEQVTLSAANGLELGKTYGVRKTEVVGSVTSSETDTFQMEARVDASSISAPTSSAADIAAAVATVLSLVNSTIATLASQTQFTLTAGPPDDEALVGAIIMFTDAASSVQRAYGIVKTYTGSSRTVVLVEAPKYTIAVGDTALANPNPRGVVEAESYAALAAEATAAQLNYMQLAMISERLKVGTLLTSRELDGSTAAMTHRLNDATTVTDQTRES